MSHPAYLAFDLGASSGRAVLGRLDGAVMRMEEVHRFPTPIIEEGEHLFWDINAKGMAVLMATHDLELIRRYPHARVFELDHGELVFDSATDTRED